MGEDQKSMKQVAVNTKQTAASVSVGGDLYKKMDELVKALGNDKSSGSKVSIKEALVLRITAGALEPIGLGLGIIIDALERAPEGKELALKMKALTDGLLALGGVGWSILKFAGSMMMALPFLMIGIMTIPLIKVMIEGLMWATKKLDEKSLKNIAALGDVGKALLILTASLVLVALLSTYALKGLFVAGIILLGFGLLMQVLSKMKLDPDGIKKFAASLQSLALGLLGLSVSLVLIGFISEYVLSGLGTAIAVLLTIGGTFYLLHKMEIDKSMKDIGTALMFAAGAILSVSIALVLSHLILSNIGFLEVGKIMLIVAGVAAVFGVIGLVSKQIDTGSKALMFAAGAILALSIAIWFMDLVLGDMTGDDVLTSFKVLAVIAGIGVVFGIAGLAESFIKKGAIAMTIAGAAMIVIGIGVLIMSHAVKDLTWGNIGMMAAIIGGLALVFGIAGIGPIPIAIVLGSAAMIVAGAALIVLAVGVKIFMMATKSATIEQVGFIGFIIGAIGTSMAFAGLKSPLIILGSAAMIVAGLAMVIVGAGLAVLNSLKIANMFESGGLFSTDGGAVTKSFMGFGGGRPMTRLEVMFEAVANSFSLGPLQIASMYASAPALIKVGKALSSIGKGLQEFQKIVNSGIDLDTLRGNVKEIVTTLADEFAAVDKAYPGGAGGLFSSGSAVARGISSVRGMGAALSGIARGMQNMANLKFPTKYDKDGNPVAYESMGGDATEKVRKNTVMIVSALGGVFGMLGNGYTIKGPNGEDIIVPIGGSKSLFASVFGGGASNPIADGISSVMGMGSALTGIAMGFQAMANLNFPVAWDKEGKPTKYAKISDLSANAQRVADNTKLIVTSLSGTFAEIGAGKTSKWYQGPTLFEKGVKVVNALGLPLKNLAEGVQNMADMKFATGYNAKGEATGWMQLSDFKPGELKKKIGTNTQLLIEALTDTFVAIGGGKSKTSKWWQGSTKFEKGAKIITALAKPYKSLTDTIKPIMEFLIKPFDGPELKDRIIHIVSAMSDAYYFSGGKTAFHHGAGRVKIAGETIKHLYKTIKDSINQLTSLETEKLSKTITNLTAVFSIVGLYDKFYWGTARTKKAGEIIKEFFENVKEAVPAMEQWKTETIGQKIIDLTEAFTQIGGSNDPAVLAAASALATTIGQTYIKMSESFPIIAESINGLDNNKAHTFTGLLFGHHDEKAPAASYDAATRMQLALSTTYGSAGDNFPKIQGAINSLDLTKLTESRKMFEALAVLSNGGSPGDILAAMGTSLEDALENLATMLEEFKETVKDNGEQDRGILSKVGDSIIEVKNTIFGQGNKTQAKEAAPVKLPSKMTVTLDQSSIDALKENGFGGGNS